MRISPPFTLVLLLCSSSLQAERISLAHLDGLQLSNTTADFVAHRGRQALKLIGPDYRVREFVRRRGGSKKPSLVITSWTGYKGGPAARRHGPPRLS
jgi:hypothetical protein